MHIHRHHPNSGTDLVKDKFRKNQLLQVSRISDIAQSREEIYTQDTGVHEEDHYHSVQSDNEVSDEDSDGELQGPGDDLHDVSFETIR